MILADMVGIVYRFGMDLQRLEQEKAKKLESAGGGSGGY